MNLPARSRSFAVSLARKFRSRLALMGWGIATVIALTTAFLLDAPARDWWFSGKHRAWRGLAQFFTTYGEGWVIATVCFVALLAAWRAQRPRWMQILLLMLAAALLAGAVVNPLRVLTGRARPGSGVHAGWYGLQDGQQWVAGKHKYSAFPSAHSAVAVAFAVPLACYAPRVGIFGVCFALGVMWSRIYLGAHHPSDVTAGALIGILSGVVAIRLSLVRKGISRLVCKLTHRSPKRAAPSTSVESLISGN